MLRATLLCAVAGGVTAVWAQVAPPPALPSFEVASVRPSTSDSGPATFNAAFRGTTVITNGPLRSIITAAFGISFPLERFRFDDGGRHGDLLSARFDITARPAADARPGQSVLMLRRLLIERFNLRVRTETRQMPVYTITVARPGRFGSNFRPSATECDPPPAHPQRNAPADPDARPVCRVTYDQTDPTVWNMTSGGPMAQLVDAIQARVDRPVIDATGLAGSFEWQLRFSRFGNRPGVQPSSPSIFDAFRDQLGLLLQPETGPVEVLVIDSVEPPTPN